MGRWELGDADEPLLLQLLLVVGEDATDGLTCDQHTSQSLDEILAENPTLLRCLDRIRDGLSLRSELLHLLLVVRSLGLGDVDPSIIADLGPNCSWCIRCSSRCLWFLRCLGGCHMFYLSLFSSLLGRIFFRTIRLYHMFIRL